MYVSALEFIRSTHYDVVMEGFFVLFQTLVFLLRFFNYDMNIWY